MKLHFLFLFAFLLVCSCQNSSEILGVWEPTSYTSASDNAGHRSLYNDKICITQKELYEGLAAGASGDSPDGWVKYKIEDNKIKTSFMGEPFRDRFAIISQANEKLILADDELVVEYRKLSSSGDFPAPVTPALLLPVTLKGTESP